VEPDVAQNVLEEGALLTAHRNHRLLEIVGEGS
jgi:hypothetical protein